MDEMHTFSRDEVLPSYFENVLLEALSVLASNFAVVKLDATHIRVPASAGGGAAVIAIQGRPRWSEANVDRVHPGGAAGTYDVYVTASDQNISNAPAPNTDNTNYSFGLAIVAAGATPVIVAGTVDIFRRVGSLQWDGGQITQVDPTVNVTVAGIPAGGPATQASLRKLDQTATGATAGNDSRVPSQAENDALLGTSGAPSNGNRFVTDADPRNANARAPTGHHATHEPGGADALLLGAIHRQDVYANRGAAVDGILFYATDKGMLWKGVGSAWQLIATWSLEVNTLPASPIDLQEVMYRVADGVFWHLRYRQAELTYPWVCLGGQPQVAERAGSWTPPGGLIGYVGDPASGGFNLNLSWPGDWEIEYEAAVASAANAYDAITLAVQLGGGAVLPGPLKMDWSRSASAAARMHRTVTRTLTRGVGLDLVEMAQTQNGTTLVSDRILRAKPVRIST